MDQGQSESELCLSCQSAYLERMMTGVQSSGPMQKSPALRGTHLTS